MGWSNVSSFVHRFELPMLLSLWMGAREAQLWYVGEVFIIHAIANDLNNHLTHMFRIYPRTGFAAEQYGYIQVCARNEEYYCQRCSTECQKPRVRSLPTSCHRNYGLDEHTCSRLAHKLTCRFASMSVHTHFECVKRACVLAGILFGCE